jgi:hypothetical protein
MKHEELLFKTFIHPNRQERFLALLAKPKRRAQLTGLLGHSVDLDPRYATKLPSDKHSVADIEQVLRSSGAPVTCYLVSEDSRLDQKEMLLSEALREVVGRGMGTFVLCVPGKLGYYEGEDAGERYILKAAT